jgi:hypothetical protein
MPPMAPVRLSDDPGFDFALRCLLSGVAYGMAEPGEVLAVADRLEAGDRDSWFDSLDALADRCQAIGESSAAGGHRHSAYGAFLRAANYRYAAFYHALGTRDPGRALPTWRAHRAALDRAFSLRDTPVERFEVATADGVRVRGWLFTPAPAEREPRPVVIVHNLLTAPLSDVLMTGVDDAVRRGWAAVAFEGPGQGATWFEDGVGPVDGWGAVAEVVTDRVAHLPGIDPTRMVAMGVGDGGYLAAVAAGDPRTAALVCDPGVVRVADGVLGQLPEAFRQLWSGVDTAAAAQLRGFDDAVADAARSDTELAFTVAKVVEQWPTASLGQVLARLSRWDLSSTAHQIGCPTWIADPDAAVSFPGQSVELAALLGDRATVVPFAGAEGAGLDCEIGAPGLRNQRVFDWLDECLR